MSATHRRSPPRTEIDSSRLNDLLSRLQKLLPELRKRRSCTNKALASKLLQETCHYIRYLQREVDDLSDQLLQLMDSSGIDNDQAAAMIRQLVT